MRTADDPVYKFLRTQLAKTIALEPRLDPFFSICKTRRVGDVGCGSGSWLSYFSQAFAPGSTFCGVDPDPARIHSAAQRLPHALFSVADGCALPWPDGSFDLVSQFVVFSSVADRADRAKMASEMRRVLKPEGVILWHDFFAPNPLNRRTTPINRTELARLFPDCRISLRRVTLAAPLARCALRLGRGAAETLDRLSFLHTHYLAIGEKHGEGV